MNIYRWNGTAFESVGGALTKIVAGSIDSAVGINADDGGTAFYRVGGGWRLISGAVLTDISAAGSDVWGINRNKGNKIYYAPGAQAFAPVDGELVTIDGGLTLGGGGQLFGVNANQEPFRWNGSGFQGTGGQLGL